eukprot:SAG11_NODE_31770_length_289_cov_0.957895_1_plen_82_part_01
MCAICIDGYYSYRHNEDATRCLSVPTLVAAGFADGDVRVGFAGNVPTMDLQRSSDPVVFSVQQTASLSIENGNGLDVGFDVA